MTIFKLTAEDTPGFDHKVLALYEQIIEDATRQIAALSNITDIDEKSIRASIAPQTNPDQTPNRVQDNLSIA